MKNTALFGLLKPCSLMVDAPIIAEPIVRPFVVSFRNISFQKIFLPPIPPFFILLAAIFQP
jgi:hypothetical protein